MEDGLFEEMKRSMEEALAYVKGEQSDCRVVCKPKPEIREDDK